MEYPKIQTLFQRNPVDMKRVLTNEWRDPAFRLVERWLLTEKIDGTNIRLILEADGSVRVGGRTERAQIQTGLLNALNDRHVGQVAAAFEPGTRAVIYGEGHGAKIQKGGGLYCDAPAFVVFDVAVLTEGHVWWLNFDGVSEVATKIQAAVVPVVRGDATVPETILLLRNGLVSTQASGRRFAEGVVARTEPGLLMRTGKRLIWKLKARDFGAPDGAREVTP